MPGLTAVDAEMQRMLDTLRTSSISMANITRCRRVHFQDKICINSIAKELELPVDIVTAACWSPPAASTAYQMFVSDVRGSINGDGIADVMRQAVPKTSGAGGMWSQLGTAERSRYEAKAKSANHQLSPIARTWENELSRLETLKADDTPLIMELSRDERKAQRRSEDEVLDQERLRREQQAKQRKLAQSAVVGPPKSETELQVHNRMVRKAKEDGAANRAAFFQRHRAVLQEFGARVPEIPAGKVVTAKQLDHVEPPPQVTATMRDYQLQGLKFLCQAHENGISAVLGDEMGLGKTLQTIAFLAYQKYVNKLSGPSLVVAPLSVLSSWLTECKKFCPSLRVVKLHSSDSDERERLKVQVMQHFNELDVVVTTYEMAKSANMSTIVRRLWWRYLILDEGHVCKNEESQISQAVRGFHFQGAILLTGTPVQNNLHELWALLNLLFPSVFVNSDAFDATFDLAQSSVNVQLLLKANRLLKPLMLRRIKADVEKSLPPKLETKISCGLTECQRFWYKRLLLKDSRLLSKLESDAGEGAVSGGTDWKKLQSLMMQLRKCANHPFLFSDAVDDNPEAIVESSGKMQMLDRLLKKLHAKDHRVVLFSQFTSMLDLVEEYCQLRGWKYCRLDGSVNRVQRTVDISCFNAPGSKLFIFLMSTRAGGLGVNLQSADTCILYDSDWNPQPDLQAMARVHRIGQKKKVHVYRLVATGTVEERIVQRAEKKLYLDQMVNRPGQSLSDMPEVKEGQEDEVSTCEMLKALQFGAQSVFSSQGGNTGASDEELDAIIDRTRTGNENVGQLKGGASQNAAEFSAESVSIGLRQFEGAAYGVEKEVTFQNCKSVSDIGAEWQQLQSKSREKKSRVETEWVKGVGEVQVLRENNVTMDGTRRDGTDSTRTSSGAVANGRQIAGRDYDHESHCLQCWDGGDLVLCDLCPSSFHPKCLGLKSAADIPSFGTFACPHHSCGVCGRKSAAAGGLLFRCMVCPYAFCEDHLPAESCIVGHNERLEALGFVHPKQGCYVFCGAECVSFAHDQGLATESVIQATAGMVLGTTGVDLTKSKPKKAKFKTDTRTAMEKLTEMQKTELAIALGHPRKTVGQVLFTFEPHVRGSANFETSLDVMSDALFETDRSSQKRMDVEPVITQIKAWNGVGGDNASDDPSAEQAAEFYLRVSRILGSFRGQEIRSAARCLGVMTCAANLKAKRLTESQGMKGCVHAISLFFTRPAGASLLLTPGKSCGATLSTFNQAMKIGQVPRVANIIGHPLFRSVAFPKSQIAAKAKSIRPQSMDGSKKYEKAQMVESQGALEVQKSKSIQSANLLKRLGLAPVQPKASSWVSCDDCTKWRRVEAHQVPADHKRWTCRQSTDLMHNRCELPQELSDAEIDLEISKSAPPQVSALAAAKQPQQPIHHFFTKQAAATVVQPQCVDLCSSDDENVQQQPAAQSLNVPSEVPKASPAHEASPATDPRDKKIRKRFEGMSEDDKQVLQMTLAGMSRPEQNEYLDYLDLERAKEESKKKARTVPCEVQGSNAVELDLEAGATERHSDHQERATETYGLSQSLAAPMTELAANVHHQGTGSPMLKHSAGPMEGLDDAKRRKVEETPGAILL